MRRIAPDAPHLYYRTTSLCPTCVKLVDAEVVRRDDGVFIDRACPEHGRFEAVICSDVAWYDSLGRFDVEPQRPLGPGAPKEHGCPDDCGLCSAHRQMAGTAAIEISNRCNADCPTCLADNKGTFDLTVPEVESMIEALLRSQRAVDVVTLSGGEPTSHDRLFDVIRALERPEIGRVALNSNGLRIARDDAFLDELARHPKVYVTLHFDGPGAKALRGIDAEVQERAIERLCRWGINVVPVVLAARGVNDEGLGPVVRDLLVRSRHIKSVMLSMMTYTGQGGSTFTGDPRTRLTIPGALDAIEAGSAGALKKGDFIPLPMPNPLCAAIGYFLVEGAQITALRPLADEARFVDAIKNSNFANADEAFEGLLRDGIDRIYAHEDSYPDAPRLLASFRRLLEDVFPSGAAISTEEQRRIAEERIKTVYLFQLMDAWTFDTKRMNKCSCQHLLPGGKIIPSCGYYTYHRRRDPRFIAPPTARAPGGH